MRLSRAEIQGFRCLRNVSLAFADLTVLLGSNSTGKSSALKALKFFFENDKLDADDVFGRTGSGRVSVRLTFDNLSPADRETFGLYAQGEQMVLTATWEDGDRKLTGRGLRYPGFVGIREEQGAPRTAAYRALRAGRPELDLPQATTIATVDNAMLAWEMEHPGDCEPAEQDASALFGYSSVGQSKISSRFKFVFVPGLRDAAQDAVEQKGSLLEQLLAAIAEQRAEANEELVALEEETQRRYAAVIEDSHGPTLRGLAESLEGHLRRYVPNASLTLQPVEAKLKVGSPQVRLQGGEAQDLSDLGRQGHGFQRTFIIAALEYLAETAAAAAGEADRPTLFFAIEEPELYQHPPRARHFFNTLSSLTRTDQNVQVCYATHSPYFVSPADYASIRIFRRLPAEEDGLPGGVTVGAADPDAVAAALPEDRRGEADRYLARTMRDAFCEALFARTVVVVEGATDAAVLIQTARLKGLDLLSTGVVFVPVSKSAQQVAVAVLQSLEIPTYVVFDADGHQTGSDRTATAATNRALLGQLGGDVEDFPETCVSEGFACFSNDLENFLESETDFATHVREVCQDFGWAKPKAPEVYAEAVERIGADALPPMLVNVVERVAALAR